MKKIPSSIFHEYFHAQFMKPIKKLLAEKIMIELCRKFAKIIMNLHIVKTCLMISQKIVLITRSNTYSVGRETLFQPLKCCPFMPARNTAKVPMLPKFLQQVRICSIKRELQVHQAILPLHLKDQILVRELQAMPALLFCFSPGPVRSYFLLVLYCMDKKINLLSLSFLHTQKRNVSRHLLVRYGNI